MSYFLSNILGRYNQNQLIVRPRSPGIYENHSSRMAPVSTPSVSEVVNHSEKPVSSENQSLVPPFNSTLKNDAQNDTSLSQEKESIKASENQKRSRSNRNKKIEIVNRHSEKKASLPIEELQQKGSVLENVNKQSNTNRADNKSWKGLKNEVFIPKPNTLEVNFDSQRIDKQIESPLISEQLIQQPIKKFDHHFSTKFNHFNEINLNTSSPVESTQLKQNTSVKIHIGRIEIKAVKQNLTKPNSIKKANKPGNSLEQFLNKRGGNSK